MEKIPVWKSFEKIVGGDLKIETPFELKGLASALLVFGGIDLLVTLSIIGTWTLIESVNWYAIGVLHLPLVYIGATMTWEWFRTSVIGQYIYVYENDGVLNVSKEPPHALTSPLMKMRIEFREKHIALKLRVGGYFLKNSILQPARFDWEVLEHWDGSRIIIADRQGKVLSATHSPKDWAALLHSMVKFRTVDDAADAIAQELQYTRSSLEEAREDMRKVSDRFDESVEQLEGEKRALHEQRMSLGLSIARILEQINQNRKTLGKSEHAKRLRVDLEKLLAEQPPEEVSTWKQRATEELKAPMVEKEACSS